MPGVHDQLANRVLANVGLSDTGLLDAATTEMPTSADSYGFELFQGATCAWYAEWTNAVSNSDTAVQAAIIAAVESTITTNTGTDFERAAEMLATPLLDTISGRQPDTENDYTQECPDWAHSG